MTRKQLARAYILGFWVVTLGSLYVFSWYLDWRIGGSVTALMLYLAARLELDQ